MDFVLAVVVCFLGLILALPVLKRRKTFRRISYYIDRLPGDQWYPLVGSVAGLFGLKREGKYWDILGRKWFTQITTFISRFRKESGVNIIKEFGSVLRTIVLMSDLTVWAPPEFFLNGPLRAGFRTT